VRYDHVHWSIVNAKPLDKGMGTTTDKDAPEKAGEIYLLGRSSAGTHHALRGPLTRKQYRALSQAEKDRLPSGCER